MNPGGPNLGPSSVLDRVKMFLPQMAQANLELEKQIAGEGSDSVVIDKTILAEAEDSDEEEEEEEGGKEKDSGDLGTQKGGPMIKIDFALGDFDQHPIALAEDEKGENEENTAGGAKSQGSSSAMEQQRSEEEEEEEEDSDEEDEDIVNNSKAKQSIFRVVDK